MKKTKQNENMSDIYPFSGVHLVHLWFERERYYVVSYFAAIVCCKENHLKKEKQLCKSSSQSLATISPHLPISLYLSLSLVKVIDPFFKKGSIGTKHDISRK